jgi:hypothetical protein
MLPSSNRPIGAFALKCLVFLFLVYNFIGANIFNERRGTPYGQKKANENTYCGKKG